MGINFVSQLQLRISVTNWAERTEFALYTSGTCYRYEGAAPAVSAIVLIRAPGMAPELIDMHRNEHKNGSTKSLSRTFDQGDLLFVRPRDLSRCEALGFTSIDPTFFEQWDLQVAPNRFVSGRDGWRPYDPRLQQQQWAVPAAASLMVPTGGDYPYPPVQQHMLGHTGGGSAKVQPE